VSGVIKKESFSFFDECKFSKECKLRKKKNYYNVSVIGIVIGVRVRVPILNSIYRFDCMYYVCVCRLRFLKR